MDIWLDFIGGIIVALIAFFATTLAFMLRRHDSKREMDDLRTEMLIGLGHDRVVFLGMCYIERGWLTQAEYENIKDYLYKPYSKMGGNGTAEKIMQQVDALPIRIQVPGEFRNVLNDGRITC